MTERALLVADSFRVREGGWVRGWELHRDRFRRAVHTVLEPYSADTSHRVLADLDGFLESSHARFSQRPGFPRLELWDISGVPQLEVSLRATPEITSDLALVSVPVATVPGLRHVTLKGPNLSIHSQLVERYGQEVLLTRDCGTIIEGTRTAILWWRGNVVHRVADDDRVDSVTEHLVARVAERLGFTVSRASVSVQDLITHEVWAVNALHGIRVVTEIDGRSTAPPDRGRLERFRAELEAVE